MVHGKEVNLIAHNKHLKRSLKKISGHLWISKVRNVIYNYKLFKLELQVVNKQCFDFEEVSDKHQLFAGCFWICSRYHIWQNMGFRLKIGSY